MLTPELNTHPLADNRQPAIQEDAVRASKIDELEDARCLLTCPVRITVTADTLVINDHDFARLNFAHHLCADRPESAAFRGNHPTVRFTGKSAKAERANPQGITDGDQGLGRENRETIGTDKVSHCSADSCWPIRTGCLHDHPGQRFGIGCALERGTTSSHRSAHGIAVHEIAIMRDRNDIVALSNQKRSCIDRHTTAGCRVTRMANGNESRQRSQVIFGESAGDEAHARAQEQLLAVARGDPCTLLPAVLQRKQSKERQTRDIASWRIDTEDATCLARPIVTHDTLTFAQHRAVIVYSLCWNLVPLYRA